VQGPGFDPQNSKNKKVIIVEEEEEGHRILT
jgi:hypothetical protein